MWLYKKILAKGHKPKYVVGYYTPTREWFSESDHGTADSAANRVHWLNGGGDRVPAITLLDGERS